LAATGPQGSAANSAGNVWTGPPATSAVADAATAPSVVMTSRYYAKVSEKPFSVTPSGWFNPTSGNPAFTIECPGASFSEPPSELNIFDSLVVSNAIPYPAEFQAATRWWNERNLYEKLVNNPGLTTNNGLMSNFVQGRAGTPLAQLLNARKSISTVANNTAASFTAIADQDRNIIKNLANQSGLNDSTVLMITDTVLAAALKTAQGTATTHLNNWKAATAQSLTTLRATVANIAPSNLFETNEQWVLMFYLDYPVKGLQPSAALLEQLRNLGLQCPLVAGPAAVSANTLYELLTNKQLKKENCVGSDERNNGVITSNDVVVYPNPANNSLEIILNQPQTEKQVYLEMYNQFGQSVLRQYLSWSRNSVSTAVLPNGIYTICINTNEGRISTQKVVILH